MLALRWFVGLNLDQDAWDALTFSQNRRRRFDESSLLERLFDDSVRRAMAAGLGEPPCQRQRHPRARQR
jgi:transposase